MAAVKLHGGVALFLLLSLVAASSTTGLRKRIAFSIKKQESDSSLKFDEIAPISQQPEPTGKRSSFSSKILERMRPRTRTSSSDSISSPSMASPSSLVVPDSSPPQPQPATQSMNYFDLVQGIAKVFDIDALQREEEAKAHSKEVAKSEEDEALTAQLITAGTVAPPIANSHSIASFSTVGSERGLDSEADPEEAERALLLEDSQVSIEQSDAPKQLDLEFTNLGSNLLEDDFIGTQKLIEDELFSNDSGDQLDYVMVEIPNQIQKIIIKQETFKKITSKLRNPTPLVNQIQKLLVEIVKKIFFNQPPKNPQSENEDSVFVPMPALTYLTDLEMVELLLSSPGRTPKHELRLLPTMLNQNSLDGKFKITPNSALPSLTSFAEAKQLLMQRAPEEFNVIQGDVGRTPRVLYRIDREWKENRLAQASALEEPNSKELSLPARISYALFYVLAVHWRLQEDAYCDEFMYEEVVSFMDSAGEDDFCEISQAPLRYAHTQGFHQIAAYFVAKFDLRLAGPLTLRFMERFMPQLMNHQNNLLGICNVIETDALHAVRTYLENHQQFSHAAEIILDRMSEHRISALSMSILHFSIAPGADELEEYVQFLLTQIPAYLSDSAVAIIYAARILYVLPTYISSLEPIHSKVEDMDGLLSDVFLEIFQKFGPAAVFPDTEMKILLEYARQLIPIMTDHKTSAISSTKKQDK